MIFSQTHGDCKIVLPSAIYFKWAQTLRVNSQNLVLNGRALEPLRLFFLVPSGPILTREGPFLLLWHSTCVKVFDCQNDNYFLNYSRFLEVPDIFSSRINAKNFSAKKIRKK